MSHIRILLTSLLVVLCCSGCGTVATHVMPRSEFPPEVSGIYRGTKFHSFLWSGAVRHSEAEVWGYMIAFSPFLICDFPLCLAGDTLLLPLDLMTLSDTNQPPNHALQRTRHGVVVCNRCVPWDGSLSLGR